MELQKQKNKSLITLIIFWILVGITTTLVYNLEWFIQKVVIFNGGLQADLNVGKAMIDDKLSIVLVIIILKQLMIFILNYKK